MALRLLVAAVVAACLPGRPAEERLLIVYPAGSRAEPENNVIEDGWVVAEAKPAKLFKTTEKSVTRTKSSSSVSTSYSVSSSVSSRRADPGEGRRGRVGRLDRGRMRDLYSRRPPTVARTLVIPPARLMLTRGSPGEKQGRALGRTEGEAGEAGEATDRPGGLETSRVAGRRSWEVRREEAIGRREERNVARAGGRGVVRQYAIPVYTVTRRKYTHVRKKAPVAPRAESVRSVERVENNEITDEKKKVGSAVPGPGWGSQEEQRSRLRRILAPKPRHSRGPVPTLTTPEEEEEEEEVGEFSCPAGAGASTKLWRAHPDPVSCRHYYICVAPGEGRVDGPAPVRHGCTQGLVFSRVSETCVAGPACGGGKAKPKAVRPRPVKKQGLFVEFIEFLIRSRLFNERVVKSLLDNKELFQ